MIDVTERAAKKFQELMEKKGLAETAVVKLGVKGGGCSGFEYTMDFCDKANDDDKTWEVHGVTVTVDKKSFLFMAGTKLDYVDDLMESGFKFENPNATGACGCGKSVSF